MKRLTIIFISLALILNLVIPSLTLYAYHEEENTTTDETNVAIEEENGTYSSRSTIIEGGGEINGELWYAIDLDDEGKPIITYDIDYSRSHLLEYLKPGDIVYERNAGFDVVDFLGHIAMVIEVVQATPTQPGYVLMIESLPSVINNPYTGEPRELGVCYSIMTPTRFRAKRVSIMRVKDATDEQIQGAVNWAVSRLGKKWRFPTDKHLDNNNEENGEGKNWYCSELVWAAYCLQDIDLVEYNILPVAPEDIYKSDEVATILDYSSPTTFGENTATHHTFICDGDTYTEEHDFVYESVDGVNHLISCFCGYTITVPHEYTYTRINWDTHLGTCICGHTVTENHSLEYEQLGDSENHKETCTLCEHSGIDSHNYKCYGTLGEFHSEACIECGYAHMGLESCEYVSIDENSHSVICPDCEHSVATEAHNWAYTSVNALSHEKYCADCGYVSDGLEVHSWTPYNSDYVKCSYCGFLKKKTGNIIIPVQPAKQDDDYSE